MNRHLSRLTGESGLIAAPAEHLPSNVPGGAANAMPL